MNRLLKELLLLGTVWIYSRMKSVWWLNEMVKNDVIKGPSTLPPLERAKPHITIIFLSF